MKSLFLLSILLILAACTQTFEHPCLAKASQPEIDNCFLESAQDDGNATLCDHISRDSIQRTCLAEVSITSLDLDACDSTEGTTADYCRSQIAIAQEDGALCFVINNSGWRDVCYHEIAQLTLTEVLCSKVDDQETRDQCYADISIPMQSARACAFILEEFKRDRCFVGIALLLNRTDECELSSHPLAYDSCYKNVAKQLNNISICENVRHLGIRSDCISAFD